MHFVRDEVGGKIVGAALVPNANVEAAELTLSSTEAKT